MSIMTIAEIGINHNGSLETAFELIEVAGICGFDAVKFQKRNPMLYPEKPYSSPILGECSYREHKQALELTEDDYRGIDSKCQALGIQWLASCFDYESVDLIAQFEPEFWKIASPCALDIKLTEYIAQQSGKVLLSTGMSLANEVARAVATVERATECGYDDMVIMHCCSEYPTPLEHVNLNMITTYKTTYPCTIGYSSHDAGVNIPVVAAALGADVIEVHVTLDRAMLGSDHAASLERAGMETLVRHVRALEKAMGSGIKQMYPGELAIRKKVSK